MGNNIKPRFVKLKRKGIRVYFIIIKVQPKTKKEKYQNLMKIKDIIK
jgi:hypothetical protein